MYWGLHGSGGVRHAYTDDELRARHPMLLDAEPSTPAYVLFNDMPRVGDAKRFARLVAARSS
ncbi:hypothetical protein K2Z84_07330 [Candidatus Binatia bacterium]|nr:hypothetical protein [Candidatus Binatia bacterium]